jgi:hypothetical protein
VLELETLGVFDETGAEPAPIPTSASQPPPAT